MTWKTVLLGALILAVSVPAGLAMAQLGLWLLIQYYAITERM